MGLSSGKAARGKEDFKSCCRVKFALEYMQCKYNLVVPESPVFSFPRPTPNVKRL
jgi:hypothetical protein